MEPEADATCPTQTSTLGHRCEHCDTCMLTFMPKCVLTCSIDRHTDTGGWERRRRRERQGHKVRQREEDGVSL